MSWKRSSLGQGSFHQRAQAYRYALHSFEDPATSPIVEVQTQQRLARRVQVHQASVPVHGHDARSDIGQDVSGVELELPEGRLHLSQSEPCPPDPIPHQPGDEGDGGEKADL